MTLLLWEQLLGNWGAVGNAESDIAIEEFDPYDSHALYEIFLGVDPALLKADHGLLFKEMIRRMWPELLAWPFNPPGKTMSERLAGWLKQAGLYGMLQQAKYTAYRIPYELLGATR